MKKHRLIVEHIFDSVADMNVYISAVHPGCAAYIYDDLDRLRQPDTHDYVVRRRGMRPDQFLAKEED